MISADTNIFIYALDARSRFHPAAWAFMQQYEENDKFAVCDLMLVELYMQLRNSTVFPKPMNAAQASDYCRRLAHHPVWSLVSYESNIMDKLWTHAATPSLAFRRIIDARLALTLRHHGVTEFATANVRDFQEFGFERVWNPLIEDAAA